MAQSHKLLLKAALLRSTQSSPNALPPPSPQNQYPSDHRPAQIHIGATSMKTRTVPAMATSSRNSSSQSPSKVSRCLCSPTTHAGSFRCRLHRSSSSSSTNLRRSPQAAVSISDEAEAATVTLHPPTTYLGGGLSQPQSSQFMAQRLARRAISRTGTVGDGSLKASFIRPYSTRQQSRLSRTFVAEDPMP